MFEAMFGIAFGAALFVGSAGTLWFMMPRNGKLHRHATIPLVDSLVPFGIICGMTVGLALFLSELPVWK